MAVDGRTITVNVKGVIDGLTGPLNQGKQQLREFGQVSQTTVAQVEESTEKISRLWRAAFEAFIGVEAIKALKDLALGASEASDELDVASRVATNFGHALSASAMEEWLQRFAKSAQGGGYAINQMREAVEQFADVGLTGAEIQRALADTASLAAAHNLDFAQAQTIVRYALTGHVEMLTRYGIISREAAKGIHTVEQAMDALEHATKGASEERANKLLGDFGRLGTAASLLADAIGRGLAPFFSTLTAVITNVADALKSIPAPVMTAIGTFAGLATTLFAVTLILPAIRKGFDIATEGVRLLLVIGNPLITFFGRLIPTIGLATTGMEAFSVAEIEAMGPIAALVIAIIGVALAADELVNHLDHVKKAWHDWTQYLSDSFHEFAENFRRDHATVIELVEDLAAAVADPTHAGIYLSKLPMLAPKSAIKDGPALEKSSGQIGSDIVSDLKHVASDIGNFFKTSISKITIPHDKFPGIIPSHTPDTSAKVAENALKNFDEALKNWLDRFQQKIDRAKSQVDIATEKLADFDVKHPADQAMSAADQATRQGLVNDELKAERALRETNLEKARAESAAAQKWLEYAGSISKALKNHDQLVRQALDGAREHAKAARDLSLAYLQAGTALDSIIAKERQAANERIDRSVEASNAADEAALAGRNLNRDISGEDAGQSLAVDKARGKAVRPEAEDQLKIALDQLAVAAAIDTESLKQNELARARAAYDQTKSVDDLNRLREAQNALTAATLAVDKAENQRAADEAKLTADQATKWTKLIDDLTQKAGAPGLTSQAGAISFNPWEFLMAAFEQSTAFADVMGTVNQIVQTFAQILSALRPVINALLDVVRTVVNVFIFLYDTIARILNMFGLQLQILNYLNGAYAGMVPLIEMWHEIPTLNELAAGQLNSPLSTIPQQLNALGQQQGQGTMRIVGILMAIFAAMIVAKVLSGMSLTQAVQQTLHLIGINVGQKFQTAQQTITNTQLMSANTTLLLILEALQAQALGSGFGGILGAIFSGGASVAGMAAAAAAAPAMGAMATAAQAAGTALQSASRAFNQAADMASRTAVKMQTIVQHIDQSTTLQASVGVNGATIGSDVDVDNLAARLAQGFLKNVSLGTYGLNRVPNQ